MNLVVDFGNTLVKLAVFDKGELVAQRCMERLHPSVLEELLSEWPVRRAVVASTRGEVDDVAAMLRRRERHMSAATLRGRVHGAQQARTRTATTRTAARISFVPELAKN